MLYLCHPCYIYVQVTKSKATDILESCNLHFSDSPGISDGFCEVYRLKPNNGRKVSEGVFEHEYGLERELLPEKVVMLVGTTGAGKSTLINRMINHILGVEFSDNFRFQLVVEQESSQTESQTKDIIKYVIHKSRLPYKLIVIDTPGFGDTAGKEVADNKIQSIENLFKSDAIISIDAICFVEGYNNQRLTDYRKELFDKITSIFGSDTKENIYILATFCDGFYDDSNNIEPAPALESFKKLGISYRNCFPFNNKNIFAKPKNSLFNFWKTSMTSFDLLFVELDKTNPVSIKLSSDILGQRHIILHAKLPEFVRKLKDSIHEIDAHSQDLNGLIKHKVDYVTKIEKLVMEDIVEPNRFCMICTRCTQCGDIKVCHDPCTISRANHLWWCHVMSWFNRQFRVYCHVCKCPWDHHKSSKQRPVRRTFHEVRNNKNLNQEYLQSSYRGNEEDNLISLINSCKTRIVSEYSNLLKDLEGIQECIDFINNKCLSTHPTSIEKYLNEVIEKELVTKEDGYLKRITVMENLIDSMKRGNIYEAFQQASDEDKVQQAKECYQGFADW